MSGVLICFAWFMSGGNRNRLRMRANLASHLGPSRGHLLLVVRFFANCMLSDALAQENFHAVGLSNEAIISSLAMDPLQVAESALGALARDLLAKGLQELPDRRRHLLSYTRASCGMIGVLNG